jgi:hypothetical protein
VPLPELWVLPFTLDADGLLSLDLQRPWSKTTLPDEFFLRELRDLDVTSPGAILDFVNTYGMLSARYGGRAMPSERAGTRPRWNLTEFAELLDADPVPRHIREIALSAQILRDGVETWLALQGAAPMDGLQERLESGVLDETRDTEETATQLALLLNWGLQPFQVRVSIEPVGADPEAGVPYFPGHHPDLFGAVCLQVANHIAEGATYSRCKNETCGGYFYRQRGRAEYGQHRTGGLKYCSSTCAKTQTSRDSRRAARLRKANEGPSRESGGQTE